ncbi:MAG: hypothetical protein AAB602_00870 [Patescibacteria group bacterium]
MRLLKLLKIFRFLRGERQGFSIIELLVVISITIMISALALTYTSSTQQQIGLYVEVQKLAELILRAKSLAVSTYNDKEVLDPGVVNCGYGVNIDYGRNGYELFSYRVIPEGGKGCEDGINTIKNTGKTRIVTLSRHDVAPGVVILENRGHANRSIYKVFFVPPVPITLIGTVAESGLVSDENSGKIYLTTKDASLNAAISVSEIGQVDF